MTELQVVLLPDKWGEVAVCDFEQLVSYLVDDESLEEAIENSAIDSGPPTPEFLAKVRALNETGNARAYWGIDG